MFSSLRPSAGGWRYCAIINLKSRKDGKNAKQKNKLVF